MKDVSLRDRIIDIVLLLAVCTAALLGLAPTFTGWSFAVVGGVGLLVGTAIGVLVTVLRWPAIAGVLIAVVAFLLLGGPLCLRSEGGDAMLPLPGTIGELVDQSLYGWKDLLTTLPPVDGSGPLLVLPWLLGLVAGLLGTLLLRFKYAGLPLLAPLLLLVMVILLGVRHPQSLWVQGAVLGALALAFLAIRAQRSSGPIRGGAGRSTRLVVGAALLGVAGALAVPVATLATGGDAADGDRVVLRTYVEPPFDVGQYPSPLASFRRYVKMPKPDAVNLYDKTLFTVDGLPEHTRIRFATLDHYDGVVWGASNDAIPGATNDTYQRVSSTIDNPVDGKEVDVEVEIGEGYSGVWLPLAGALQSMDFTDGDPDAKAEAFRYNLATSTAVVPSGIHPGDRYSFSAVLPKDGVTDADLPSGAIGDAAIAAAFLDTQAVQWSKGESEPMKRVFAVAEHLKREGKYSDGVLAAEKIYHAGHHVARLSDEFVNAPIMVGNDEQYAAVMALLANKIGVPARVVMGAVVPEGGEVKGSSVQAWVELQLADGTWRTLPTSEFMDTDRPAEQPPQTEQEMSGTVVPPPAPIPPPSTSGEQTDAELNSRKAKRNAGDGGPWSLPAWAKALLVYVGGPLLLVVLLLGAVVGAKLLRRRRRLSAAKVSARFVGAWRELVDHARDLGQPIPMGAAITRREQSTAIVSPAAPQLARIADGYVFGPAAPDPNAATSFWTAVDAERRAMSSVVPRGRRLLAAVNLRSFGRR
ncbi:transglutaminase-like domain-containing protein [Nocardioides speluncae]|uniref:transglutaminase-like domain-containing protein n=1 Tax=Nocardioides speluncae TaxID=2670337 RepID=UPI000D68FA11|nr:transglutaminase-like domain-containing protein [Nocardioides speluncae]